MRKLRVFSQAVCVCVALATLCAKSVSANYCLCQYPASGTPTELDCKDVGSTTSCSDQCSYWSVYTWGTHSGPYNTSTECAAKKLEAQRKTGADTGNQTCLIVVQDNTTKGVRHTCEKLGGASSCNDVAAAATLNSNESIRQKTLFDDPSACENAFSTLTTQVACKKTKNSECIDITVYTDSWDTIGYFACFNGENRMSYCQGPQCCIYQNDSGRQTCQCGTDNLTDSGSCKSTHGSAGSLVSGPYHRTACADKLDSEPLTVDLLPKYEKLSQTSLDEINPLTQSKVLSEANTRTPGALVSRLVRNIVFPIAGLLLFLMITWSGFQIVQGGMMGDDNAVSSGKGRLTATIVGFLLLFGSYWLWSLVEAALGLGTTS